MKHKETKQRLFEVMGKVDKTFKPNNSNLNKNHTNLNDKEQQIFNDILSTNEGVGDWWNKFVQYGKKGLLTTAIIFAIASSAQAQQQNKTADVIKAGIELTQNQNTETNKDLHNLVIGMALYAGENYMKQGKMELQKLNSEVIKFHVDRKNGMTTNKLSPQAKAYEDTLFDTAMKMNMSYDKFVENGKAITSYTHNNVGF